MFKIAGFEIPNEFIRTVTKSAGRMKGPTKKFEIMFI